MYFSMLLLMSRAMTWPAACAARKVVLRLDDGSVIAAAETLGVADASTPAVALDPDKAFAAGRLAPEAVTKLEELLRTFADKFPSRHLRTVDLKRRASDAFGEVSAFVPPSGVLADVGHAKGLGRAFGC